MLFDILYDRLRNEVPHAHVALEEQPDLGGRNIVLDELVHNIDVVFEFLTERSKRVFDISSCALNCKDLVCAIRISALG